MAPSLSCCPNTVLFFSSLSLDLPHSQSWDNLQDSSTRLGLPGRIFQNYFKISLSLVNCCLSLSPGRVGLGVPFKISRLGLGCRFKSPRYTFKTSLSLISIPVLHMLLPLGRISGGRLVQWRLGLRPPLLVLSCIQPKKIKCCTVLKSSYIHFTYFRDIYSAK